MSAVSLSRSRSSQGIMLPKRRMNSSKRNMNSVKPEANKRPYSSYSEPVGSTKYRIVNLSCPRTVTSSEMDGIVDRLTRPTISSRGGVDIADKDFEYIKPRPRKTLIIIPGLERRYMGLQKVTRRDMVQIVARLTRMTTAYTAKFGPCPNGWEDDSPAAKRERFSRPATAV